MTKDLVIKAREDFGTNPIKITCDNMIIVWDNSPNQPGVIWDDANERLIAIRQNTEDIQAGYPAEVLMCNYEMIQYIEGFLRPADAFAFIEKAKFKTPEDKELAKQMVATNIQRAGLNATRPMSNINPERRY